MAALLDPTEGGRGSATHRPVSHGRPGGRPLWIEPPRSGARTGRSGIGAEAPVTDAGTTY